MMRRELPPTVLGRRAVVYVRQSSGAQVHENLEAAQRAPATSRMPFYRDFEISKLTPRVCLTRLGSAWYRPGSTRCFSIRGRLGDR